MPSLEWRHNGRDSVSNHQPHDCLLNRLSRRRSKNTSKLRVTGLCAGNSPGTGEFPAQRTSNAENVFIWWRHHENAKWLRGISSTGETVLNNNCTIWCMERFPLAKPPVCCTVHFFLRAIVLRDSILGLVYQKNAINGRYKQLHPTDAVAVITCPWPWYHLQAARRFLPGKRSHTSNFHTALKCT